MIPGEGQGTLEIALTPLKFQNREDVTHAEVLRSIYG
jgi:hypothetical protein